MKYEKKPLTVADQVNQLISRGLLVEDREKAEASLLAINYYRLSGYFVPFETKRGEIHEFRHGSRFEDIVDLYTFDHKLRILVFDALERIETTFRTQLIYRCSLLNNNGWWYENRALFYDFNALDGFLEELDREVRHSKEIFIRHYHERYGKPTRPPAWIAFEVASLGQLSRLYKNMKPSIAKKEIADFFGIGIPVLESWLECLTNVRNTCAHHARLWNKTLVIKPKMPSKPACTMPTQVKETIFSDRIHAVFIVIQYCLSRIGTLASFPERIEELLSEYPNIDLAAMGVPKDWRKDTFWDKTNSLLKDDSLE